MIEMKKIVKRIICAVVGHKRWMPYKPERVHYRRGRRYVYGQRSCALCERCVEFYTVEEKN